MATVDVVYAWGSYNGPQPWSQPTRVAKLGTGGAPTALGQCTQVNGEAGWFTYIVGGVPYGLGNNTGMKLSSTSTNPYTQPVALAASVDNGVSGLIAAGAVFPIIQCDGGDQWVWALDGAGSVWAIGTSNSGVLGNFGPGPQTPTRVPGIGGVGNLVLKAVDGAISGGSGHAIGLQVAGTVVGCGENNFGELGNNSTANSSVAVQVLAGAQPGGPNLSNIVAVSVGNKQSGCLDSSGNVWMFGMNTLGQCGNGTNTNCLTPVAVDWAAAVGTATPPGTGGVTVTAVSAGGGQSGVDGQTLVLASNGIVWGWGANTFGQLGLGSASTPKFGGPNPATGSSASVGYNVPQQVNIPLPGGASVTAVSSGARHGIALRSDGALFVWGDNTNGELGNPSLNTAIPGISGAVGTSVPTQLTLGFPSNPTFNLIWAGNQTTTVDLSYTPSSSSATSPGVAGRPGPGLMVT